MLKKAVVLAILIVCVGGFLGFAEGDVDDGSVAYPTDAEIAWEGCFLCPPFLIDVCCYLRGCPIATYECSCINGWVVCFYWGCEPLCLPPCCRCVEGRRIELRIRCTPGEPIPTDLPGVTKW